MVCANWFWVCMKNFEEENNKLRVMHICLASHYTEGMTYQDNILPAQNRKDGHDVLIVSDCKAYREGRLVSVLPEEKILEDGVRLVRLDFAGKTLPNFLRDRLCITPRLFLVIEEFRPDVILYHGIFGVAMFAVAKFKRRYPETKLYFDTHMDYNNSGRGIASRVLQYKFFNRLIWRFVAPLVDKVFYISYEARDFARDMYNIDDDGMEFFPLGGFVKEYAEKAEIRKKIRDHYGFDERHTIFVHSGKFNGAKRTLEVLRAFSKVSDPLFRLMIVGVFDNEIQQEAFHLINNDPRLVFVGWKSGEDLVDILCASDCYLQPGSQSATLQVAICCGLPVVIYPFKSHFPYLINNGYFVRSESELAKVIGLFGSASMIDEMSRRSISLARSLLDYKCLAARLYR